MLRGYENASGRKVKVQSTKKRFKGLVQGSGLDGAGAMKGPGHPIKGSLLMPILTKERESAADSNRSDDRDLPTAQPDSTSSMICSVLVHLGRFVNCNPYAFLISSRATNVPHEAMTTTKDNCNIRSGR